jgi:hypothetical protein
MQLRRRQAEGLSVHPGVGVVVARFDLIGGPPKPLAEEGVGRGLQDRRM